MSRVSCESPLKNYFLGARDIYNSLSNNLSLSEKNSPFSQIQIITQTVEQIVPIVIYGLKATHLEKKNERAYDTGVRYIPNGHDQMVYATGPYQGLRPRDLNEKTARLNPDLYNPDDLKTDLATEAAFRAGAMEVVVVYPRKKKDYRNIHVYKKDKDSGVISLTTISTSPDGKGDPDDEILKIITGQFPDLAPIFQRKTSSTEENHLFVLSDIKIPQEKINEVAKEFGVEMQDLKINEEKMWIDKDTGNVFVQGANGQPINIENIPVNEDEKKQQHRLVRKIQSAHTCAIEEDQEVAFFYAPKNLGNNKNGQEISQIIVDKNGNVTFKTINLSENLTKAERQHLLTKLGYKKDKTPLAFSYTDVPLSDEQMKNIVRKEMNYLQSIRTPRFLLLHVFPVFGKFDFFGRKSNKDRTAGRNSTMFFHDMVFMDSPERMNDDLLNKEGKTNTVSELMEEPIVDAVAALIVFPNGKQRENPFLEQIGKQRIQRTTKISNILSLMPEERVLNTVENSGDSNDQQTGSDFSPTPNGLSPDNEGFILIKKSKRQQKDKPVIKRPTSEFPPRSFLEEELPSEEGFDIDPSNFTRISKPEMVYGQNKNDISVFQTGEAKSIQSNKPRSVFLEGKSLRRSLSFHTSSQEGNRVAESKSNFDEYGLTQNIKMQTKDRKIPNSRNKSHKIPQKKEKPNHYRVLKYDSEQMETPLINGALQFGQKVIKAQPEIRQSFSIGEKIDLNFAKRKQEEIEKIWKLFLGIYWNIYANHYKQENHFDVNLYLVAKQEIKSPTKFFGLQNASDEIKILGIIIISIFRLLATSSEEIKSM